MAQWWTAVGTFGGGEVQLRSGSLEWHIPSWELILMNLLSGSKEANMRRRWSGATARHVARQPGTSRDARGQICSSLHLKRFKAKDHIFKSADN